MKKNLSEIIRYAVATEKLGYQVYLKYSEMYADQEEIKKLFKQLALDEDEHMSIFSKAMGEVQSTSTDGNEIYMDGFDALNPQKYLEMLHDETVTSVRDVMECVYRFEEETLMFYTQLESVIGKSTYLSRMIDAEKNHLDIVLGYLCTDAKFKGISPDW